MSAILSDPLLCLRPMCRRDLSRVVEVEQAAYAHPWTERIFLDCLRVGYGCWVYSLGPRLIGHGVMSVAVGECHILNLCVHPDWQGQGLGRRILRHMLNNGRQRHADTAFLEVRASNQAALRLYGTEGFNELGRRKGYYPAGEQRREDALILAKSLL